MYITEVSGHHSATMAIEGALRLLQPNVEVLNINAFNYTNPLSEKIVHRLYMGMVKRMPRVWDYLYDNPRVVKKIEKAKESINKINSPKLKNLFDGFRPDAVACTQAFPCGMVAGFKKAYNSKIPLLAILTDYIPHSYWIYDNIDCYITPSQQVSRRLLQKGVTGNKIKSLGIPFDPEFNEKVDNLKIMRRLKLSPDLATILIMGGGHGLGPIEKIIKSLEGLNCQIQEIIVTGTNTKLYNSLKRRVGKYKNRIVLFGYAENINELMSISDILITKPGGVTCAEALAKKIPMLIVNPLPGQEASNTAYLTAKGAALKVDHPEKINFVIEDLIQNPNKRKRLSDSAACISKPNASLDIAKLLLSHV